jgi:hypothetical protein
LPVSDPLSRKDALALGFAGGSNAVDWQYEADDDLDILSLSGPVSLLFDFSRNNSGQITGIAASDGAFLALPRHWTDMRETLDRLGVNQWTGFGEIRTYCRDLLNRLPLRHEDWAY